MIELELLGTGADGQSLVLTDAEGERYSVPVTDELRGAVRRDRPRLESVPDPQERPLRPREIQALLRSGLTAEELARESGMDIAHIRRFEAPVAAEKEWALSRALETHVGGDRDAPVMGDLVVDRLAARGVDPASLSWTARRPGDGPWEIALTFLQGAAEHAAHWTLAPSATSVEAIDQEARWITETASPSPVSAVFSPLPTAQPVDTPDGADDVRAREALVEQLNAARGHRQGIDIPLDDPEDDGDPLDGSDPDAEGPTHAPADTPAGSLSARIYSLAHARTRGTPPATGNAPRQPTA
ncbi:septation protein SepH, partial [Actinomyces polynesiensis]|uniref:septation protein SepH n=1 Tax=Actinomyces polynesiensis TaxID=1325934 RepID=UPI0006947D0C